LATDVDAKKLGIGDSEGDDKRYFLKTMIEKDIDLRTLVALWKALFPKDNDFLNRPEVAEVLSQIPSKPGSDETDVTVPIAPTTPSGTASSVDGCAQRKPKNDRMMPITTTSPTK
jgi:hypothetical protein